MGELAEVKIKLKNKKKIEKNYDKISKTKKSCKVKKKKTEKKKERRKKQAQQG